MQQQTWVMADYAQEILATTLGLSLGVLAIKAGSRRGHTRMALAAEAMLASFLALVLLLVLQEGEAPVEALIFVLTAGLFFWLLPVWLPLLIFVFYPGGQGARASGRRVAVFLATAALGQAVVFGAVLAVTALRG